MACGWRLYGDLPRLRKLSGSIISVDLLNGTTTVAGRELQPTLEIAQETSRWLTDRFERARVPPGTITAARLTLALHDDSSGMLDVECVTVLETTTQTYSSRNSTRWGYED